MNPVASAAPSSVPRSPVPARGQTETQLAAQHMTPKTRALLPDSLLNAKIGRSTLAGSLNDQVRFRVDRTGSDASTWAIEPDSPTAAALMQTKAGPELMRQLRTATNSTGHLTDVSNLKGFILAEDNESALAGAVIASLDHPTDDEGRKLARLGELNRTSVAGRVIRAGAKGIEPSLARAGAWNSEGWITFVPDTARAMLINAGAYKPDRELEPRLLEAVAYTKYLAGNGSHEVQHSVSGPSPTAYKGTARWMEEGTANVFSRTPTYHAKQVKSANLRPEVYASRLAHEPSFDTGWKPWTRPTLPKDVQEKNDKDAKRNYGDSQVVLRDLVHLAGGNFRSNEGKQIAFELLQRKSMRYTAGVLANAIIERHQLDPSVYERLRGRIGSAVDIEGGVKAISREFGIDQ